MLNIPLYLKKLKKQKNKETQLKKRNFTIKILKHHYTILKRLW